MLLNIQKKVNSIHFLSDYMLYNIKTTYICNVFFMVLDLRLMKIGCRETANFFFAPYSNSAGHPFLCIPCLLGIVRTSSPLHSAIENVHPNAPFLASA